jgi:hypothetical protein
MYMEQPCGLTYKYTRRWCQGLQPKYISSSLPWYPCTYLLKLTKLDKQTTSPPPDHVPCICSLSRANAPLDDFTRPRLHFTVYSFATFHPPTRPLNQLCVDTALGENRKHVDLRELVLVDRLCRWLGCAVWQTPAGRARELPVHGCGPHARRGRRRIWLEARRDRRSDKSHIWRLSKG